MAITPLPTAPSRSDPSDVFNDRADAWVAALPPWTDEVNSLAADVDVDATSASSSATSASSSATSASSSASSASSSASAASSSAQTALSAPGTSATSTTSVLIGTGSKSFTVQTGKDLVIGMLMVVADDAAPTTNRMFGGITSYNPGTGSLVLDVSSFDGSGTKSAWTISISGKPGAEGGTDIVNDTTPQLGGQLDVNGFSIGDGTQELLSFTEKALAVNQINVTNAVIGDGPILSAVGDDPDIDLVISGKGTGKIKPSSPIEPDSTYIGSGKGSDLFINDFSLSTISSVQHTESVASEDTVPNSIAFNNDGSKIFMVGDTNNSIYEYNLTTPFDLSTKSAVINTAIVSSEDTSPQGIVFNNNGSKIFMVGSQNDSIHEYNLTTPFDLSTISAVQVTRSVASEDTVPNSIAFNNDGSKIFMVGSTNGSIYEYNLTTPFDLSTISAVQVTRSVASEDSVPLGIAFNNDGSKIFMVGSTNDSIYEYNLTTPFDLSTISAVQVTRSVASEDAVPNSIAFNDDGSKIYIVGFQNASIYEYNLGESFNLRSLTSVVSKSVSSEDSFPKGIAFNADGSKIYMVGLETDSVYEYNLTVPFDLSTKSDVNVTRSVASEDASPQGIAFNADGSKIYMVGIQFTSIYEYNLTTNFDLSTKSTLINSASVASEDLAPTGISFNNDGSKIFMIGDSSNTIYEYNLITPFDISTISAVISSASVTSDDTIPVGIAFNNDGSKIFMVGQQNDRINEYNLGTNFDLSTISVLQNFASVALEDESPQGIAFNTDGSKVFMIGDSTDSIYEYNLVTPFIISPLIRHATKFVTSEDTSSEDMSFNNDGYKIYMVGKATDTIYEYNLTVPFDISTALYSNISESVLTESSSPTGIALNNDGSKIYMLGAGTVYEYNLTVPFDLSTKSAVVSSASFTSEDSMPIGIAFNDDGSKIFISGSTNSSIYEYNLTTPFDISTISVVQQTESVTFPPQGIAFNNDGSKIFILDRFNDDVYEYNLTVPFDISTLTPVVFVEQFLGFGARGLAFNSSGSKIFLVGSNEMREFNLLVPLLTIGTDGDYFDVRGTQEFSSLVIDSGRNVKLNFNDSATIVVGSGITLNNDGNNYTTSVGDVIELQSTATNEVVGVINRFDGSSVVPPPLGAWTLIGSVVANNDTTLTITGLDDTYETYAISLSKFRANGLVGSILKMRTGTSSGIDSGTSDYSYHTSECSSGSASYIASFDENADFINVGTVFIGTFNYVTCMLFLQRSTTSDFVQIHGITNGTDSTIRSAGGHIVGTRRDETIVDRVQVLFDAGDIVSGRMTIWGISHE